MVNLDKQEPKQNGEIDIYIIGTEIQESQLRSPFWEARPQVRKLDPEKLRKSLLSFVQSIRGVMEEAPVYSEGFCLEEIEFHIEIGIDGSVGFLGTAVKSSGKGGATMKFVRRRETR